MSDRLLWKALSRNDFNAMRAQAQQSGSGGGARHIALGVDNPARFPVKAFLTAGTAATKTIATEANPPRFGASTLTFAGDPTRRGGEWRIADQAHHRHPAWTSGSGFPTSYSESNPPIVLVARVQGKYHVRFVLKAAAATLPPTLEAALRSSKGVATIESTWLKALEIPQSILEAYKTVAKRSQAIGNDEFSPDNNEDGRARTLTDVVRRQGQRSFRKKLLIAYRGTCAISESRVEFTLEAAHITPYLGPKTNHISNGILLRADLHTLFDLALISIDPATHLIRVSSELASSEYAAFDGKAVQLPDNHRNRPSGKAFAQHFHGFQQNRKFVP